MRARLLALAKARNQPFDQVLTRFAFERLLYRLGISRHRRRFVLKGAMLLSTWIDDPHRPTRDIDFLGFGDPAPAAIADSFREICTIEAADGIAFDADAIQAEAIRSGQPYGGVRLKTTATIDGARPRVVIDVGFGDAVEPGIMEMEIPALLDLPPPRLCAYAPETVVAEKFQAMVALGHANSRVKDYYDLWVMSRQFAFDGDRLARAIAATFTRRGTAIPVGVPPALGDDFGGDALKRRQWAAFLQDIPVPAPSFAAVVAEVRAFVLPHAAAARGLDQPSR